MTAKVHLRILATSDVHGHVLPFDYFTHETDQPHGLARVATLVGQARAEAGTDNCLLLDNGDFLQGTALSDLTPQPGQGWHGQHPVLRAMNKMGYDAATLGNHEFNFGLDWLREVLRDAAFPLTCANAVTRCGDTPLDDQTFVPPYVILTRQLRDADGGTHILRIGLIGLTPPQITTWDHAHLSSRLSARDMVECAQSWVPVIRSQRADLVIALAHTGIEVGPQSQMPENAACAIARVPGISAVVAGHTHLTFPDLAPGDAKVPGIDPDRGTLHATPCVMPGFGGSHLGQLDLDLTRTEDGWQVAGHNVQLRPTTGVEPCPQIVRSLAPAHAHTVRLTNRIVARTDRPIHSYLSLVQHDLAARIVNDAQRMALEEILAHTPHADLPVLSATAPFKTGGRGGPEHFTDIPAGPLRMRNIADLYGFPNTLCGLIVTGADLRDWLERASVCFNRITPGRAGQTLLNADVPGHAFDVIDGLSYRIDVTQPSRCDVHGRVVAPAAKRIRGLSHAGRPVADTDRFAIAVNSYRAWGGGPFRALATGGLLHFGHRPIRDIIADHVTCHGTTPTPDRGGWRLVCLPGTRVEIETGPGVRAYPDDIAALGATDLGTTDAGFARLQIPLGHRDALRTLANPEPDSYIML